MIPIPHDEAWFNRDAFSRMLEEAAATSGALSMLKASWLDTQLGPMVAIASDEVLYLLEFVDSRGLEREVERLKIKTQSAIIPARTAPIDSIEKELTLYFEGRLKKFQTPLFLTGTPFQKQVWAGLQTIPYGETRSYLALAKMIGRPGAYRAVAQANGANQLALIIPCHRVINTDGALGGYAGGITRKQWLLDLERGS